jgi:hypothetical protein
VVRHGHGEPLLLDDSGQRLAHALAVASRPSAPAAAQQVRAQLCQRAAAGERLLGPEATL